QEIAQTIQLEALNRQLVTVLASMAVKNNDAQLKKLLAGSGVNLDETAETSPPKKRGDMAEETDPLVEEEEVQEQVAAETTWSNLPFIITLAALTIYFGFQTAQLLSERGNLAQVKSNQEAAIQEAQKVQTQFRNLVTKTSQLA